MDERRAVIMAYALMLPIGWPFTALVIAQWIIKKRLERTNRG